MQCEIKPRVTRKGVIAVSFHNLSVVADESPAAQETVVLSVTIMEATSGVKQCGSGKHGRGNVVWRGNRALGRGWPFQKDAPVSDVEMGNRTKETAESLNASQNDRRERFRPRRGFPFLGAALRRSRVCMGLA